MTSFAFVVRAGGPCPCPPTSAKRASPHPFEFQERMCTRKMPMNHFLRARVPEWEKRYVKDKAAKAHMSESEFLRHAAFDKQVTVIEGVDELLTELRYQGNNLNQLTVMARQGRIELVNMEPFMEVYERTWQTLNSLLSHAV